MNCAVPLSGIVKDPEKFYDREDEIWEIADLLENGENVAVVGEPAIGKSTVLWWLYKKAENDEILQGWRFIYIDMQAISSKEELMKHILGEMDVEVDKGKDFQELKEMLEDAIRDKRVIIILDEFDKVRELPKVFDKDFRDWLRSRSQNPDFGLVISLREKPSIAFPDRGSTSPFYNIFKVQEIFPFDEETVKGYVQRYGVNPQTGEEIYNLTNGHPRMVNLAIHAYCKWRDDNKIKSKYRSWKKYFEDLRGMHEPPKLSKVNQVLGTTWAWISRIALFILGFLGTAMIIDDPLHGLLINVIQGTEMMKFSYWLYMVLLVLISLSSGMLTASLGLEGIVKLVSLVK